MYSKKAQEKRSVPWNQGIVKYQSEFAALSAEYPGQCPACGCTKLHKWGKYERHVIEEGEEHRVCIQRIRCVKCGKTHSYLPSFCVSRLCYGADFIMAILKALLLKIRYSLENIKRRAYAFLKRFRESENLWLVVLRARGFGCFPVRKKERTAKIFIALLELYKDKNFLSDFLRETGRHFMSVK